MDGAVQSHEVRRSGRSIGRRMAGGLGWLLIFAAVAALAYELGLAWQNGAYRMVAAGELWYRLDPSSLNLSQAIVQRYLHPVLWNPVIVSLLQWPAWSLLGGPGVLLVVLFPWRRGV